jgi:diguanylate cyclase
MSPLGSPKPAADSPPASGQQRRPKPSLWGTYLICSLILIGGYFFIPGDTWTEILFKVVVGWAAVVGIVAGVRRHRPPAAAAWYLFAAGVFANATGILVAGIQARVLNSEASPSLADPFWLALYPALFVGMALLIRRRSAGSDWATLVDATIISTGLGLLCWVYLIHPAVGEDTISQFSRAVVIAYPVGDLVVISMLVRLLTGSGSRNRSFALIVASMLAFLVGDIGWAVTSQLGLELGVAGTHLLDMVFLTAYSLLGAAALHPSAREVGEQVQAREPRLSPGMLGLLTVASLIAPTILLIETASGRVTDGVAIGVSSTALFLLVVTRMAQLLRLVEAQASSLRKLALVDELTGLPNRRALASDLAASVERARRDRTPLSVAMIDLDHFKVFNDTFGHPAGDRLLKAAAAAWLEQVRAVDRMARYGGEEFITVMNNADSDQAAEVLTRMQAVTPGEQTFSGGIAIWDGSETSDQLVARADQALYDAKAAGRNCVVTAETATTADSLSCQPS